MNFIKKCGDCGGRYFFSWYSHWFGKRHLAWVGNEVKDDPVALAEFEEDLSMYRESIPKMTMKFKLMSLFACGIATTGLSISIITLNLLLAFFNGFILLLNLFVFLMWHHRQKGGR